MPDDLDGRGVGVHVDYGNTRGYDRYWHLTASVLAARWHAGNLGVGGQEGGCRWTDEV